MYTLRILDKKGSERNYLLGTSYTLVDSMRAPEEFERTKSVCYHENAKSPQTFAFVIADNGIECYPLHEAYSHYIMTESGKTFTVIHKN